MEQLVELIWLVPALPLAGFLTILVFGRRLGEPMAGWVATGAMAGSFVASVLVFLGLQSIDPHDEPREFIQTLFTWVPAGDFSVDVGFLVDPLSVTMILFVTGVGALIHLYSIGYMHGDEKYSKFFLYLNLFAFSMLMLVLGDNMLLTFLGWEGVGACSYFLISFWHTSDANATAGKKAFVTNRIGDWGFMVAMFLTFFTFGSIQYTDINHSLEANSLASGTATAIALLLFVGAAGKSAQFPLYLWLPDAMAGPTPVSALIHAATMVTSGVYLLTRTNAIMADAASWAPSVIAWIGAGTALFAATIAVSQRDIKKVLAYSTVSQLGYMFLAIGTGAYVAAIFHMVTHAFFKALLFLGSGSVIHGMDDDQDMAHYGGLRKFMPITAATFIVGWLAIAGVPPFSGFWSKDEILAFAWQENKALWAVGFLTAILTAFYMSRQVFLTFFGRYRFADVRVEEIDAAWDARRFGAQADADAAVLAIGAAEEAATKAEEKAASATEKIAGAEIKLVEATAALDGATDDDREKLQKAFAKAEAGITKANESAEQAAGAVPAAQDAAAAARAQADSARAAVGAISGGAATGGVGLALLEAPDPGDVVDDLPDAVAKRREYHPHESPWQMTVPLILLAGLAAVAGVLNLPFSSDTKRLEHWLEPVVEPAEAHLDLGGATLWILAMVAVIGGAIGIAVAVMTYLRHKIDAETFEQELLAEGWYYDRSISNFMGGPGTKLFNGVAAFDSGIVDGAVNGVAKLIAAVGGMVRKAQTGLVRWYASFVLIGAVILMVWFTWRAA